MAALERAASAAAIAAQLISLSKNRLQPTEPADTKAAPCKALPPPVPASQLAAAANPAHQPQTPLLDLRPLNGLRAVSSIAVVLFHCYLGLWSSLLPFETTSVLTRHHWIVRWASVGGPLGVEFFLITTALLATYQLVPLLEGSSDGGKSCSTGGKGPSSPRPSCRHVVLTYWRRRALRLLPAYAVANLLILFALPSTEGLSPETALARNFAFGSCPSGLWRNALFLTNVDVSKGCGVHLWSLALQYQFYLAFPILLCALRPRSPGFRARLAATLAAIFAGGTAWRLWLAFRAQPLHLPLGDLALPSEMAAYGALLTAAYFPTGTRVAELALGAALGLLLRSHAALSWLARRRALLATAALCLQAAFYHTLTAWAPHGVPGEALWRPLTARLYTALLYWGSPLVASCVSLSLLAIMLHSDPLHSALASLLSCPRFKPLSKLSYCLYLVHEQARLAALLYLVPAGTLPALLASAPVPGLTALTAFTLAAAYACAYLLHVLVECRF